MHQRYCLNPKVFNLENENSKTADIFSNIEAEQALIGAILWDNKNYEKVADFLEDKHFVEPNNQIIFKTISMLLNKNMLVSPITLKSYLPSNDFDFDNLKYLNQIKDTAPSTQNPYQYGKIIYDLHIKRNLISIGQNLISDTTQNEENSEGSELIEKAENDLYQLSQTGNTERKYSFFREALKNAVDIINEAFKRDGKIAGLATGLKDLDKKLGGLHNSDLIIVAGRPSMGKTALGTNIA